MADYEDYLKRLNHQKYTEKMLLVPLEKEKQALEAESLSRDTEKKKLLKELDNQKRENITLLERRESAEIEQKELEEELQRKLAEEQQLEKKLLEKKQLEEERLKELTAEEEKWLKELAAEKAAEKRLEEIREEEARIERQKGYDEYIKQQKRKNRLMKIIWLSGCVFIIILFLLWGRYVKLL
jgi:hypothetical protein